jgi:prepilin-type N-terminal cleavage/methylation domain-containing protein
MSNDPANNKKIGFTLIEVLLTVSILSCSMVLIFNVLFGSIYVVKHINNRFESEIIMDNETWNARQELRKGPLEEEYEQTKVVGKDPGFTVDVSLTPVLDYDNLYLLKTLITWEEGRKNITLERSLYLRSPLMEL